MVTTMLLSHTGVIAMLAVPSRAPSFISAAAVLPVSRSPSFRPIRSHAVVPVSLVIAIDRGQGGHA